jgi:hypothetical protein
MVRLLAELLDAELLEVSVTRGLARRRQLLAVTPAQRRRRGGCLVIAAEPRHLLLLLNRDYLLHGHDIVAGWVIDSFWTERIPRAFLRRGHFDRLFVTDQELVGIWQAETGVATSWLPWGSDVLRLGSGRAERPIDLQRLGRQPPGWEDNATRTACERLGLRFAGRPPVRKEASDNQGVVMEALGNAKFALAFSNAVSGADYTHPTREYITARWTDSVASGATVAGVAPRVAAAKDLLPAGTTLELESTDLEAGLERIAEAVATWSPERAAANHRFALERLDWRWRFLELATALDVQSAHLDEEIEALWATAP